MKSPAVFCAVLLWAWACAEPVIVAHRGASADFPENTLEAFIAAFRQGADAIEADFRMTKDGVIVCIHDEHTGRVSSVKKTVARTEYASLRKLNVGAPGSPSPSHIPTFAEVANTVPSNRWFYIEVKGGVEMVPALMEQIEASALKEARLRVISFDPEVIREVQVRKPDLTAYWLVSRKRGSFGRVSPSWNQVEETLNRIDADGVSCSKRHVSKEDIQRIRDQGFSFHVWTVDDPLLATKFMEAGVSSITTNAPGKLKETLRQEP